MGILPEIFNAPLVNETEGGMIIQANVLLDDWAEKADHGDGFVPGRPEAPRHVSSQRLRPSRNRAR